MCVERRRPGILLFYPTCISRSKLHTKAFNVLVPLMLVRQWMLYIP